MSNKATQHIYVADSYLNGISFGANKKWDDLTLRLENNGEPGNLKRRYALFNHTGFGELEKFLIDLSSSSKLKQSVIILGVDNDPFFPFDTAFSASLKFLELLERYKPGKVIIQTRSPLIVIALPVLQKLKTDLKVVFALETSNDEVGKRYFPELPYISERIKAIRTLKRFGFDLSLQIAPILPYGDWRKDAGKFASLIAELTTQVQVASLAELEKKSIKYKVSQTLTEERKFHWLRDDASMPLIQALNVEGVELVNGAIDFELPERQLSLFGLEKRA